MAKVCVISAAKSSGKVRRKYRARGRPLHLRRRRQKQGGEAKLQAMGSEVKYLSSEVNSIKRQLNWASSNSKARIFLHNIGI